MLVVILIVIKLLRYSILWDVLETERWRDRLQIFISYTAQQLFRLENKVIEWEEAGAIGFGRECTPWRTCNSVRTTSVYRFSGTHM